MRFNDGVVRLDNCAAATATNGRSYCARTEGHLVLLGVIRLENKDHGNVDTLLLFYSRVTVAHNGLYFLFLFFESFGMTH